MRQALADCGVTRNTFGTTRLECALAGVGGAARPVLLGVRNSFRRRGRLLRTALTPSAAGVCFVSALNVRASIIRTLDHLFSSMRYDVHVWLDESTSFEKAEGAIRDTPGLIRAEGWLTSEAAVDGPERASGQETGEQEKTFSAIALPPETDLLTPELVEGRGLRRDDTNAVVVNARLAQSDPRWRVGSEVSLRMGNSVTAWRVVGRVRVPFAPAGAYVSKHYLEQRG